MTKAEEMKKRAAVARGEQPADTVIKNSTYLNVFTGEWLKGDIAIESGLIVGIGKYTGKREVEASEKFAVPGFIDSHVHLESSIVSPREYAKTVVPNGTLTAVADPHEIANVIGERGMEFMLQATSGLPLDVFFMIPSCVPSSQFDESGAVFGVETVKKYLDNRRVLGLAEMMDYNAVIEGSDDIIKKLEAANRIRKVVDGHAPGLTGKMLNAYIAAGITSDHECATLDEATEKLRAGQWIMIREGTAGRNLTALLPLLNDDSYRRCTFCTDDRHPTELINEGHIDDMIRKAIAAGANPEHTYICASYNAARRFGLMRRGAIAPGFVADLVLLDDVNNVRINSVLKRGVYQAGFGYGGEVNARMMTIVSDTVNIIPLKSNSFNITHSREKVIGVVPGSDLTTDEGWASEVDTQSDIIKISVIERHFATGHMSTAFLKGYGLTGGAIATTISHDSHNIIVAGTNDSDMLFAVERIAQLHGGMVVVNDGAVVAELALPIAGLMCDGDIEATGAGLDILRRAAHSLGVHGDIDPFMTLSFMSLSVMPSLRITTKGVVDVNKFELIKPE